MLVFPQLSTGTAAVYPVVRRNYTRSVVNVLSDGSIDLYHDPDGDRREWELQGQGLTGAECAAIDALFTAVRGRQDTFTFLDPGGNLLVYSEDFANPAWGNGAAIQLSAGAGDPLGTNRATRVLNAGQIAQAVAQTLAVPGDFRYTLSVWARADASSTVTLAGAAGSAQASRSYTVGANWTRYSLFAGLGQNMESVTFSAQIDAGAAVDLFGMQVEAQPAPSDYKMTAGRSGLVAHARFSADELKVRAQSADVFDVTIGIVDAGR
jgi:hypothetical protein